MCVRNISGKLSTDRTSTDTYSFIYAYLTLMFVLDECSMPIYFVASMHVCVVLWRHWFQYTYSAAPAIVFAFINENEMRINELVVVVLITCRLWLFSIPHTYSSHHCEYAFRASIKPKWKVLPQKKHENGNYGISNSCIKFETKQFSERIIFLRASRSAPFPADGLRIVSFLFLLSALSARV